MPDTSKVALSDDLLWGAQAIADEIGVDKRKAFYLLETRGIPAQKVGALWVASRRTLREVLTGAAT